MQIKRSYAGFMICSTGGYCEEMSGDRTILYKMKELWTYLAPAFTNSKKYAKKIKKAEKCVVYESVINELFEKEETVTS